MFDQIIELIKVLLPVVGLGTFFWFYFKNPSFKKNANVALKFLPTILGLVASRVKDKEGVFDAHDALVVLGCVSARIQIVIKDPENKVFEDVQEEVFEIVRDDLAKYKGMSGVPDLDDPVIQAQVRVAFEGIQRAASADTT